jgi:CDGSH-type Zn-finger protein
VSEPGTRPTVIRIYPDGPMVVRGPVTLLDASGDFIDPRRETFALCRCGRSALRPFCDGTHTRGFRCSGLDRRRPVPGEDDGLTD